MPRRRARQPAGRWDRVGAVDRDPVIYSWTAQGGLDPLRVAGGEGCWFRDQDGRR